LGDESCPPQPWRRRKGGRERIQLLLGRDQPRFNLFSQGEMIRHSMNDSNCGSNVAVDDGNENENMKIKTRRFYRAMLSASLVAGRDGSLRRRSANHKSAGQSGCRGVPGCAGERTPRPH
jgi:hypothetical protein